MSSTLNISPNLNTPGLYPVHESIIQYFENKNINIYKYYLLAIRKDKVEEILEEIYENNKKEDKIIVFVIDDYEFELKSYDNQIIVRTSGDKSLLKNNEYILPYLFNPKLILEPLPKTTVKPIIGFCGWNSPYRQEILKKMRNDKRLKINFIIRRKFMGGIRSGESEKKDFYDNMQQSHFIICNRGTGNFSMRFYETLAAGRIPVLVDTDMQLPLNNVASYNDIIIMEKTVEEVIEKILFVWKNKDIEKMQKDCSEFYKKYLTEENYAQWLYQEIDNQ